MGLTLGALLLAVLPPGKVIIRGDSKYVIGLLNKEWEVRDVFLFNCVQLAFDIS
jgi:ribonuclease HI